MSGSRPRNHVRRHKFSSPGQPLRVTLHQVLGQGPPATVGLIALVQLMQFVMHFEVAAAERRTGMHRFLDAWARDVTPDGRRVEQVLASERLRADDVHNLKVGEGVCASRR